MKVFYDGNLTMNNSSNNSKQHEIILTPHSIADADKAIAIFRAEWELLKNEPDALYRLIVKNIRAYKKHNPKSFADMELSEFVNEVWIDMHLRLNEPKRIDYFKKSIAQKYADGVTELGLITPLWMSIENVFQRANRHSEYSKRKAAEKSKAKIPDDPKATHDEATTWQEDADKFVPIEAMANGVDFEDQVITSVTVRQVMDTLSATDIKIITLKTMRMTDSAIGQRIGLTRRRVNRDIQRIRAAFRAAGLR